MNDESYQFFKELEKIYLTYDGFASTYGVDRWYMALYEDCRYVQDLLERLKPDTRFHYSPYMYYQRAFWVVYIAENKGFIPESYQQTIEEILTSLKWYLLQSDYCCALKSKLHPTLLISQDIEKIFNGITLQPVEIISTTVERDVPEQATSYTKCLLL
jgi:hypothetical protein